jgi:hypothetical protein
LTFWQKKSIIIIVNKGDKRTVPLCYAKVAVAIIALACVYCPVAIPYIESAFRALMGIGTATGTVTSVAALSFAAAPA